MGRLMLQATAKANAGWTAFFRRTAKNVLPRILNICAETTRPVNTRAAPSAADPSTASDRVAKLGRIKPVQENTSPSTGAQTMGFLIDRHKGGSRLFQPKPPRVPPLAASSIISVIGETVIAPIARETATVTVARGPKTDESNGSPTAAEFGNPRVKASTALSEAFI